MEAATLTGLAAGIAWASKKVLKENVTADPSTNVMNYVKFTAVMAGSIALRDYLEKQKILHTFLLEVAKEHLLSFSDLEKKYFENFFDADDKLDSASVEGFKNFIKEHDIRFSPRSVILYLKSVETSHFRKDVSRSFCSLEKDCRENKERIDFLYFSANLLIGALVAKVIIGFAFRK